ncbi:hypothetical protein ACHAQA_003871 [Verticillium albo-atrum]
MQSELNPRSATFTPDPENLRSMALEHVTGVPVALAAMVDKLTTIPETPVNSFVGPGKVVYVTAPYMCAEQADGPVLKPLHRDQPLPVYNYSIPRGFVGAGFDRDASTPGPVPPLGFQESPCPPPVFICEATEAVSAPVGPDWLPHCWHQGRHKFRGFHQFTPSHPLRTTPHAPQPSFSTHLNMSTGVNLGRQHVAPDSMNFEDDDVFLKGSDLMGILQCNGGAQSFETWKQHW